MAYEQLSELLQEYLGLDLPPVALTRVPQEPAGLPGVSKAAPSACTFWRRAEQGLFYAAAADHYNCPIGTMVMGLPMAEQTGKHLMDTVGLMLGIGYIKEEELPNIPKFTSEACGIVYGPLAGFPLEPEAVLLWPTPAQAMLLQESCGTALWTGTPLSAAFGRPGCAAIPAAVDRGAATLSLGCKGMRTFTEVPDDRCLAVLPGAALRDLEASIRKTAAANEQIGERYRAHKAAIG